MSQDFQELYNVLIQLARYQYLNESSGDTHFVEMSDSMKARFEGEPQAVKRPNVIQNDEESFFSKIFAAFQGK